MGLRRSFAKRRKSLGVGEKNFGRSRKRKRTTEVQRGRTRSDVVIITENSTDFYTHKGKKHLMKEKGGWCGGGGGSPDRRGE